MNVAIFVTLGYLAKKFFVFVSHISAKSNCLDMRAVCCWRLLKQYFIPFTLSEHRTWNHVNIPNGARALLLGPVLLSYPNYGTNYPNSCECPPQGLDTFELF